MTRIEDTIDYLALSIPAQQSMSNLDYIELLCKKFIAPHCQECKGWCCNLCASHDGYLSHAFEGGNTFSKADIKRIKKKYGWDKETGFLSPTWCRLPRKVRSYVCNGYTCMKVIPESLGYYNGLLPGVAKKRAIELKQYVKEKGVEALLA